jgi:hypothetical protein
VAAVAINLQNTIESWTNRIGSARQGNVTLTDSDWVHFFQLLDEWVVALEEVELYVGSTQLEVERQEGRPHVRLDNSVPKSAVAVCNQTLVANCFP